MTQLQHRSRNRLSITPFYQVGRKAGFVKLNSQQSLFALTTQVWQNGLEDFDSFLPAALSNEQVTMLVRTSQVSRRVVIHCQGKKVTYRFNRTRVSHFDTKRKYIARCSSGACRLTALDSDATFSVNQSSKISKFVYHVSKDITNANQLQESAAKKSANSVDTPRGQYRASSMQIEHVGVCREHRPNAKAMMCSELCSNVQRAAEMSAPGVSRVTTLPENQDATVAQILWMGALGVNNRRKNGVLYGISKSITA